MRKNNKGVATVNIILLIFIVICITFIGIILRQDNNKIGDGNTARNSIIRPNINSSTNEYVELSNSIEKFGNNTNTNENNDGKKYYYEQLNDTAKIMYDTLVNNIDILKTGNQNIVFNINTGDAGEYFQSAWDAFTLDRPDVFWVDTLKLSLLTKTMTNIFASTSYQYILEPRAEIGNYYIDSFTTASQVELAIQAVESKVMQIVNGASGSTYDKVKYVHDYIIDLMSYDQAGKTNNSNVYGALIEQSCVCEGYAESFKLILDRLNIPCLIVYGDGVDSNGRTEAHAWNYVKMEDGNWYAVDATWDDPIIIGNGSITGVDRQKYFLKGRGDFSKTHAENGDVSGHGQVFQYPTLSYTNYR